MSSNVDRLSVAEWEAELNRQRGSVGGDAAAGTLTGLRDRFREISQRTKIHRESAWLGPNGIPALNEVHKPTLELMLLAYQELTSFEQEASRAVPVVCLDRLLADLTARQDELDDQLETLQSSVFLAELLQPVIGALLNQRELSLQRLRPVLELLIDAPPPRDLATLVPLQAIRWEQQHHGLESLPVWFYAAAIPTAYWTAALTLQSHPMLPHLRPAQILAALLADVGQLVMAAMPQTARDRRSNAIAPDYMRHPQISAALIAGISDCADDCALLAGQHHERLDGTGFPRQLSGRQLSAAAPRLTAIIRWTELLRTVAVATSSLDIIAAAASTLWRETIAGGFDAGVVRDLLATIRADLPGSVQSAVMQGSRLKLNPAHQLARPHVATMPTRTTGNEIVTADAANSRRAGLDNLPRQAAPLRPDVSDVRDSR